MLNILEWVVLCKYSHLHTDGVVLFVIFNIILVTSQVFGPLYQLSWIASLLLVHDSSMVLIYAV